MAQVKNVSLTEVEKRVIHISFFRKNEDLEK